MVKFIAKGHNSNVKMTKLFNLLIKPIRIKTIKKVFGSLVYNKYLLYDLNYNVVDFEEAIKLLKMEIHKE